MSVSRKAGKRQSKGASSSSKSSGDAKVKSNNGEQLDATSKLFNTQNLETVSFENNDKPAAAIRTRLVGLAQSFSGFEKQIQKTKEKKKEDDEQKIIEIKNDLEVLHNDIQLESKRRQETVDAVDSMYSTKIVSVRKEIEIPIFQKIDHLLESLDHLSQHIDKIEQTHEIDRENFPHEIESHSSELLKQINEFKARFEADVSSREHKDKIVQKIISEQDFRVQQLLEAERVERETKLSRMQDDIDVESRMRAKSSKSMREMHKESIDALQAKIDKIKQERELATEEVVKAIVHYTAALHDGVKIVSEAG